jgi:hypothetical protein
MRHLFRGEGKVASAEALARVRGGVRSVSSPGEILENFVLLDLLTQNSCSRRDRAKVANKGHRIATMADRSSDEGGNFVRNGRRIDRD